MNCAELRDDLSAYVDGELPAVRRAEVDAHLATCADCRQEVAELQKLATGMARLPGMQPADEFLTGVRRKIARGERPEVRSWREILFEPFWLKVPVQIAAVFVALLIVSRLLTPSSPQYAASESKLAKNEADKPVGLRDELRQQEAEMPAAPARAEGLVSRALLSRVADVTDENKPAEVAAPAAPASLAAESPPVLGGSRAEYSLAPLKRAVGARPEPNEMGVRSNVAVANDGLELAPEALASIDSELKFPDTTYPWRIALAPLFASSGSLLIISNNVEFHFVATNSMRSVVQVPESTEFYLRVGMLAAKLGGSVMPLQVVGGGTNEFFATMPAGRLDEFRSQVAQIEGMLVKERSRRIQSIVIGSGALAVAAEAASADVVLQIRVVTPAN